MGTLVRNGLIGGGLIKIKPVDIYLEACLGHGQTSMMEFFAKIVDFLSVEKT